MRKYLVMLLLCITVTPISAKEWTDWSLTPKYGDDRGSSRARDDDYYIEPSRPKPPRPVVAKPPILVSAHKLPAGIGEILIDTAGKKLYYIVNAEKAYAYSIAVGKEGFTWTGTEPISQIVSWPSWNPPKEMLKRRPDLPDHMEGGPNNPLGAVAMYLGNTLYRIHGTNEPSSIGNAASSGCIRMFNSNVLHLAKLVKVGTTVHVVSSIRNL